MAAADAFKVAAAQILRGVQTQRQEIDVIRRDLDQKRREVDAHINHLRDIIREKEADLARDQKDQREPDKDRPQKLREISDLQNEMVRAEHDFSRLRDERQFCVVPRTADGP